MFDIGIWCDDENLKAEINAQVEAFEDFRIQNETARFDILIINISDENYSLAKISSILQEMNGKTILVLLAKDSAPLLDIMGLYVYQYILHEQLVERLPSCLNSIQSYLMNITSVCIHHAQGKQYIAIHDIYAFTYEEGFVYLYLQNKKISTQFTSLEQAMNLLNSDVVCVSRQTIVSLPKIDLIQKDRVILNNGESFGLSRRRKSQVIAQWEKRGELK